MPGPEPVCYIARIEPGAAAFEAQFDAPADRPVLQSAELAGITLPSSCRNGTCRTCICLLNAGQVRYRIEWPGLSAEEKLEGYFLPCVAYPQSDLSITVVGL